MSPDSPRRLSLIAAAIAVVFVLIGAAVAWRAWGCGNPDFSLSLNGGLHFACKRSSTNDDDQKVPPVANGQVGFVYYGRKKNGDPSDKGKLRSIRGSPLPPVATIRAEDVFKGTDLIQLREKALNASPAIAPPAMGECYRTIQVTNPSSGDGWEGAWLQVQVVGCPR